jgi:hypothetical protein
MRQNSFFSTRTNVTSVRRKKYGKEKRKVFLLNASSSLRFYPQAGHEEQWAKRERERVGGS